MDQIPANIREKLEAKGYRKVNNFPLTQPSLWDVVKAECNLTNPELFEVMNCVQPPTATTATFNTPFQIDEVSISPEVERTLNLYQEIGAALANDQNEVFNAISTTIQDMNTAEPSIGNRPFLAIIAPSGSGKTQLPFALNAAGFHVVHLVFSTDQVIYQALEAKSEAFKVALLQDIKNCFDGLELSCKYIYQFTSFRLKAAAAIKFFLGADLADCTACTAKELKEFVSDWKRSNSHVPVFFLDEAIPTKNSSNIHIFRYARNLLRAVGLVVVLMGTDRTAANIIDVMGKSSRKDSLTPDQVPDWCVVITKLPPLIETTAVLLGWSEVVQKLQDARHETLCQFLSQHYLTCLPWFIRLLSISIDEIPVMELHSIPTVNLLDRILHSMATKIMKDKKGLGERDGLRGQLALHLNMYTEQMGEEAQLSIPSLGENVDSFVANHFAYLTGDMIVKVKLYSDGLCIVNPRNSKEFVHWKPQCAFSVPTKNSLLYLTLGGGATLDEQRFPDPFCLKTDEDTITHNFTINSALAHINKTVVKGQNLSLSNISATSRPGNNLEAIAAVAMDIASHGNGLSGIKLTDFIVALAVELSFVTESSSEKLHLAWSTKPDGVQLGGEYDNFLVPYLSPSNADWPDLLYKVDGTFLGYLRRTENKDQIDIGVTTTTNQPTEISFYLSGEAKNYKTAVDTSVVENCLKRVNSKVHFCIVSKLQKRYFRKSGSTWEDFILSTNDYSFNEMNVLRLVVDKDSRSLQLKCLNENFVEWSMCSYLVIFIAMEDLKFDEASTTLLSGTKQLPEESAMPPAKRLHSDTKLQENISFMTARSFLEEESALGKEGKSASRGFKICDKGADGDCFVLCVLDQLKLRYDRNNDLTVDRCREMTADPLKVALKTLLQDNIEAFLNLCDNCKWTDPTSQVLMRGIWEFAEVNENSASWNSKDKRKLIKKYCKLIKTSKYHCWFDDVSQEALAKALNVGIAIYADPVHPVSRTMNYEEEENEEIDLLHICCDENDQCYSLHDLNCSCGTCD